MIFFDEPSASLDHEGIEDFRRILADLKALGKTVVIAEHRLYFLADLYDRLYVMAGGQIIDSFAAGRLRAEDCARYGLRALDLHGLNPENHRQLGAEVASMKGVSVSAGRRALIGPLTLSLREGEVMGVLGQTESERARSPGRCAALRAVDRPSRGEFGLGRGFADRTT